MVTIHGSQNSANPGPEVPQIGASAFSRGYSHVFQAFSFRKWRNIGLLRGKHPRFCLESTEVWVQEVRCFWHIPALPSLLFRRSGGVLRGKNGAEIRGHCRTLSPNLPHSPCRTHKSTSFSALEGTLHTVRIFEGLHPFSAPHPCPASQSLLPSIAKQHHTRGVPRHACREWRGRRNIPSGHFPPVHCIPSGHIMPPKMPYPLHIPPRKLQRFHTFLLILHGNAAYKTPSCTPRYVHPVPETPQKIVKREDYSEQFIARHPNRKHSLKNHDRTRMEGRH